METKTFIVKVTTEDEEVSPIETAKVFKQWLDDVDEMGFSYEVTEQKTP